MKNRDLLIYRITTGLVSLLMTFSASMYFIQHEMVSETFLGLGFPTFIIYPLAIAKFLGLIAIWTNKSKMLKEWAYAGFTFDLLLATGSHLVAQDGAAAPAFFGLILLGISYFYHRKIFKPYAE